MGGREVFRSARYPHLVQWEDEVLRGRRASDTVDALWKAACWELAAEQCARRGEPHREQDFLARAKQSLARETGGGTDG